MGHAGNPRGAPPRLSRRDPSSPVTVLASVVVGCPLPPVTAAQQGHPCGATATVTASNFLIDFLYSLAACCRSSFQTD